MPCFLGHFLNQNMYRGIEEESPQKAVERRLTRAEMVVVTCCVMLCRIQSYSYPWKKKRSYSSIGSWEMLISFAEKKTATFDDLSQPNDVQVWAGLCEGGTVAIRD